MVGGLCFLLLPKIKLCIKICQVGGVVFFSQRVLRRRAAEQSVQRTGGSLRDFQAVFYTQTESCSRSFIHARPPAANANR
jgi:hypothetical protein